MKMQVQGLFLLNPNNFHKHLTYINIAIIYTYSFKLQDLTPSAEAPSDLVSTPGPNNTVSSTPNTPGTTTTTTANSADANAGRFVRYQFTPQFLTLTTVGAT